MNAWFYLAIAIITEVIATLSLRAMVDQPLWVISVAIGYFLAFGSLGMALRAGMPVSVAYGIWGATGVAVVAILGVVLFGEMLSLTAVIGIGAIIAGVILVETGAPKPPRITTGSTAPAPTAPAPTATDSTAPGSTS